MNLAIKRFMETRRRWWRHDGRSTLDFPQFCEGMTVAQYVALWERNRHLIRTEVAKP